MTYAPPHLRGLLREKNQHVKLNKVQPKEKKKKGKYMIVEDEFPVLGVVKPMSYNWGYKSFKDAVVRNEITFDYEILDKKDSESYNEYFKRLGVLFKRTSVLHVYNIYTVKSDKKSYKVAARHGTIARFLCQTEEELQESKLSNRRYILFRKNTMEQMYTYPEVWDDVMGLVDGDTTKKEKAILMCYNESNPTKHEDTRTNWMSSDVVCTLTAETCISKEKILY